MYPKKNPKKTPMNYNDSHLLHVYAYMRVI